MLARMLGLLMILTSSIDAAGLSDTPESITIAMQPVSEGSQRSGPLNSVLLQTLLATDASVDVFICPWARCLKAIETGAADIIDDLYYTEERAEYIRYLSPNYSQHNDYFRFYTLRAAETNIERWEDLYGKGIGVIRSNVYFPQFDQDQDLQKYESIHISNSIELLLNGRLDLIIAPPSLTERIVRQYDPNVLLHEAPYKVSTSQNLYIGVSRQSEWLQHIDTLEASLKKVLQK